MFAWQLRIDMKRRETKISFGIMLCLAVCSFGISAGDALSNHNELSRLLPAYSYYMLHTSVVNQIGLIYLILAPLSAALPFSDSVDEGFCSFRCVVLTRCPKWRYTCARAVSCFCIGFMIIAVPAALNLAWCQLAFPAFSPRNAIGAVSSMPVYDYFFGNIYLNEFYIGHPYLYAWCNVLSVGFYGGTCALMAHALSLHVRKWQILTVAAPFLIVNFASIIQQAVEIVVKGQINMAAFYAYFKMAEDSTKLPLWAHAAIWMALAGASLLGIYHAHRRDEL